MKHDRLPPQAGFTLTELMVTLAIIGICMAFGLAMMGRNDKGLGLRSGTNQVIAAIRFARADAIAERSPAYVIVDADERTISHISKKTMGLWHLEDSVTTGALGRNATPAGGQLIPGRIGQAYRFAGQGLIDCGQPPVFAPQQGLVLECWAYVEEHADQAILEKGDDYGIRLTKTGILEAYVGDLKLTTDPEKVPLHKWFYVEAVLTTALLPLAPPPAEEPDEGKKTSKSDDPPKKSDKPKTPDDEPKKAKSAAATAGEPVRTFVLYINDQFIGSAETKGMTDLPRSGARFTISSDRAALHGAVDEVRISALVEGEQYHLPDKVTFACPSQTLRFDATGKLSQPATILIKAGEETQEIKVGVLGNIE